MVIQPEADEGDEGEVTHTRTHTSDTQVYMLGKSYTYSKSNNYTLI